MKNNRPKILIPKAKAEIVHDFLCIAVCAVTIVYLFLIWAGLPETFPTHFNGRGEANGWGGRSSLLILPIISLIVYAGLTILRKYPYAFNYPCEITDDNAYRQYSNARMMISWMKLEITALFGYAEWNVIRAAFGNGPELWILPIILILLAAIIGTVAFYLIRAMRLR